MENQLSDYSLLYNIKEYKLACNLELCKVNSGLPMVCFIKPNDLIQVEWAWAGM